MANWKAPGADSSISTPFSSACEEGRKSHKKWKDATIKVLHKKLDRSDCNNFRGISLVSHAGNVLLKIVFNRLSDFYEVQQILPEEHYRRSSAASGGRDPQSTWCS